MMSGDAASDEIIVAMSQLERFRANEGVEKILTELEALKGEDDKKKFIEGGLRTRLTAILNAEEKDKQSPAYNQSFYDAVYNTAMILAKHWPIGDDKPECPITLEEITDENRFVTSNGDQYSKEGIIEHYNSHATGDELRDPVKDQLFNSRDFLQIKSLASPKEEKKRDVIAPAFPPPIAVAPPQKAATSPLFGAFVGAEISGGIGIGVSIVLAALLSPAIPYVAAIVLLPTVLGIVFGAIGGYLHEKNKQQNVAPPPQQVDVAKPRGADHKGIMSSLGIRGPSQAAAPARDAAADHSQVSRPLFSAPMAANDAKIEPGKKQIERKLK